MLDQVEVVVGVFAGQGAYFPGCLDLTRSDGTLAAVVDEVDQVAGAMLGHRPIGTLLAGEPPSAERLLAEAPDTMQLAVFTTAVAVHEALRQRGARFSAFVGHSLGEIAALVSAGALTVAEGTTVLCHRITVLREQHTADGGLLALGCDRDRAAGIVALLPAAGPVIAVDNGPAQVVVSGSSDALRRVGAIAAAVGVPATPLRSPYPFHHSALAPARLALADRLTGTRARRPQVPVFSPILGRFYREGDDLAGLLAAHLVLPVDFAGAVRRMHGAGARIWVELAAGRALTNVVRAIHPDVTLLTPVTELATTLDETAAFLLPAAGPPAGGALAAAPPPARATGPVGDPTAGVQPVEVSGAAGRVYRDPPPATPAPPIVDAAGPDPRPAPDGTGTDGGSVPAGVSRSEIADRLRAIYAAALEYPEEVFEDTAQLEADLGVDSVKQTELLGRVGQTFALGVRPEGLRITEYRTFGTVVDLVHDSLLAGSAR